MLRGNWNWTAKVHRRVWEAYGRLIGLALQPYLRHKHWFDYPPDYVNERSWEYSFTLRSLVEDRCKRILDVGVGVNAFPSVLRHAGYDVTAIDLKGSYWKRFLNTHIHVVTDDIRRPTISTGPYDAILAISTLEHIPEADSAVDGMVSLLAPTGTLILTFPYSSLEYSANVYARHDADELSAHFQYIAQSFSDANIAAWVHKHNLVETRRWYLQGWTGKFWRTGDRITWPHRVENSQDANAVCLSFRRTV